MSGDQKWNDDTNIVLGHSKSGVGVGEMISAALGVRFAAVAFMTRSDFEAYVNDVLTRLLMSLREAFAYRVADRADPRTLAEMNGILRELLRRLEHAARAEFDPVYFDPARTTIEIDEDGMLAIVRRWGPLAYTQGPQRVESTTIHDVKACVLNVEGAVEAIEAIERERDVYRDAVPRLDELAPITQGLGGRVADAWIERVRTAHVLMSAMTPADGDRIVRAALAMRLGTMVLEAQECVGSAEFFSAAEFLDPNGCRLDPPEAGVRDGYEIPRLLAQLANVADGIAAG